MARTRNRGALQLSGRCVFIPLNMGQNEQNGYVRTITCAVQMPDDQSSELFRHQNDEIQNWIKLKENIFLGVSLVQCSSQDQSDLGIAEKLSCLCIPELHRLHGAPLPTYKHQVKWHYKI